MKATSLLATRTRALIRRGTGAGALTGAVATGLGMAAIAGVASMAHGWALEAAGDVERVRGHLFWLAVAEVLVFAYTTFELSFRAADRRFIALLPISGSTRWRELTIRNLVAHLPLLAPGLGYALGLEAAGALELASYALALILGTYGLGVPLCGWVHLQAGLSLLEPAGSGRKMLAGGTVPADAALLLYTPAMGLAGTLVCVLFMDGALRSSLASGAGATHTTALWVVLGTWAIGGVLAVGASRRAHGVLHRVAARFSEMDVPGPYRDDGLPEGTPGLGWARVLPRQAAAFFERDLKQLRRRFRLDRILLWLAALAALRIGWTGTDPAEVARYLVVLAGGMTILGCHGPLATEGAELGSRWLRTSLPTGWTSRALGSFAAFASAAIWTWLWAAVASWIAVGPEAAAVMAALGAAVVTAVWACTWVIGRLASPELMGGLALVWSAVGVLAVGFFAGRVG
jgi:hypothetical protein